MIIMIMVLTFLTIFQTSIHTSKDYNTNLNEILKRMTILIFTLTIINVTSHTHFNDIYNIVDGEVLFIIKHLYEVK